MRKVITVTQQHIASGVPRTANFCPIALAIKDSFKEAFVSVSHSYILIEDVVIPTPKQASSFIDHFDDEVDPIRRKRFIQPFSFEVDIHFKEI